MSLKLERVIFFTNSVIWILVCLALRLYVLFLGAFFLRLCSTFCWHLFVRINNFRQFHFDLNLNYSGTIFFFFTSVQILMKYQKVIEKSWQMQRWRIMYRPSTMKSLQTIMELRVESVPKQYQKNQTIWLTT